MHDSKEIIPWIQEAISAWTLDRVKMQPGATPAMIVEAEEKLDFKFPGDFISLYSHVNGFANMDANRHMVSMWSLDRIVEEYKADDNKEFIGFCDFLINSYAIGFLRSTKGIFKSYDALPPAADTFKEAIASILTGSDNLY